MAKVCAVCEKKKPDSAFAPDGRVRDNLKNTCSDCLSETALADEEATELADAGLEFERTFAVWSSAKVNALPDSSFLYVESGDKDDEGKTTPRSKRHFPVKDADGSVDLPHVRNALSRVEQWQTLSDGTEVSDALRARVRKAAQKLLDANKELADTETDEVADILAEYAADDTLPTEDLDGVDILSIGGPYHGTGSPESGDYFNADYLSRLAANNTRLAQEVGAPLRVQKPRNEVGHSPEQNLLRNSGILADDEIPAAGWLTNFRFDKARGKLVTDIKKVPAKLATLARTGAFPKRSVTLKRLKSQTDGKLYDVVTALSWLGAKAPAVRTLDDIYALYADDEIETVVYSEPDAQGAETRAVLHFHQRPANESGEAADSSAAMAAKPEKKVEPVTLNDEQVDALATTFAIDEKDAGKRRELVVEKVKGFQEFAAAEPVKPAEGAKPDETKPEAAAAANEAKPESDKTLAALPVEARTEIRVLRAKTEEHERTLAEIHQRDIDLELEEAIRGCKIEPGELDEWKRDFAENEEITRRALARMPVREDLKRTFGVDADGSSDESTSDRMFAEANAAMGFDFGDSD